MPWSHHRLPPHVLEVMTTECYVVDYFFTWTRMGRHALHSSPMDTWIRKPDWEELVGM
jgi:hypothetical protein